MQGANRGDLLAGCCWARAFVAQQRRQISRPTMQRSVTLRSFGRFDPWNLAAFSVEMRGSEMAGYHQR
jgi:hypothetical protein